MNAIEKDIRGVSKSAEKLDAAAPAKIETASAGDVVRQGDIYFVCLDSVPDGKHRKEHQLAPGTSQGSRHVATGKCKLRNCDPSLVAAQINRLVKGASVPMELVGPVVVCIGDTTITHPEHGHRTLPADSCWATVYQRQHAEEVRRVQD